MTASHAPSVSVIIPCHNHGQFLTDAVGSVLTQSYQDFEIIIVDDGSTDESTRRVLDDYSFPKTKLIRTVHQGLANARNTGIDQSRGRYILPLDADDKIAPTYLERGVSALESNENIGIVYSKAALFGNESGSWDLPPYHFPEILFGNVIFCSAFFRKSDWAQVDGYDPQMAYGWEDYDLWLSLIELGRDVVCIRETLFFYRKRSDSMISSMTHEQMTYSYRLLFKKHNKLYEKNISSLLMRLNELAASNSLYEKEISRLEAAVRGVECSWSWRLTTPLRYGNQIFHTIRKWF